MESGRLSTVLRGAAAEDVPAMVVLSAAKRAAYAEVQPRFWRPAIDADAQQAAWFRHLLDQEGALALVALDARGLAGFVIGRLQPAPPVYAPGGPTCAVDDFCVREAARWGEVGGALLARVRDLARGRGAVQVVVVCGAHDAEKRAALDAAGLEPASVWLTGAT